MRKESGNGPIFLTLLAIILFTINCIELKKMTKNWPVGREPWSSGYGRRLMSKGHEFESQHCILDGNFFTFICCKNSNVCLKRQK